MNSFAEKLGKEILIFDGGMGTLLQDKGLAGGELPELWNLEHPEIIESIHRDYFNAGCDIIKTNTFGANRIKLAECGHSVDEIVKSACRLALNASEGKTLIALDIGPLGKLLAPYGDLKFDDAYDAFAEMVIAGRDFADLILIETMSDTYEAKAAILAAKENSDLPVVVTFAFDENAKLLTGGGIYPAVLLAQSLGADAVGVNCGLGPKQIAEFVPELMSHCTVPVCINPNAGLPVTVNGVTSYDIDEDTFAHYAEKFAQAGVCILGGCCGTTPAHIAKVASRLKGKKAAPVEKRFVTAVSSYSKVVEFGKKPVIIGERINPTGKPMLKQALHDKNYDFICREGIAQTEKGADILDVNTGLPEIDETAAMESAITSLQSILDTPLQIDTSNIGAMERALRIYNGRPLVNSVNGKAESLHSVLPLVKKYGACVVALTLDEEGIPETVEKRLEIARKIIAAAEEYGIDRRNLIFDPLAMTISTSSDNARITLDSIEQITSTLGVHTILGVSNISFGLPKREYINSTFFIMAMQKGLSAGIINPLNEDMMNAYRSFCALSGLDAGFAEYISAYSGTAAPKTQNEDNNVTLYSSIVKGLAETAGRLTGEMLTHTPPLEIIDNHLIPALDEVGKGFENKTVFLPQLLMSADAAKAAFEKIKEHFIKNGGAQKKKGRIILATVKGDVHDIGKNIVKVLLENYGFEVIDLGKDVPPELVVETAVKENIRLVGLSALMTTTVTSMEETIKRLRQATDCKVMVGGAVLNQEYANSIGADFYSKDAMGSVRYAEKIFSNS